MRRMDDAAEPFPGMFVNTRGEDDTLAREFEAAVRDTSHLAVRVAYSVLRRREDAEEVAQEAYARAARQYGRLRDRARFRGWMVRTVWRLAIDRWRADRRRAAREEAASGPAPGASAEDLALASERSARLWAAIDALPEKLRIVIVLSAIEGHGVQEIAHLLGLPEGTVKSRLFLARKGLAQRLRCLASDTRTR